MARKAFYSFHYKPDSWRASKVRQMGVIEGNQIVSSNHWEEIKAQGDDAVKRWISKEQKGKSVVIVLIGSKTAGRPWVKYEIQKGWNDGKGVLGVYIHNLTDRDLHQSQKGRNPFEGFYVGDKKLSSIVKAYDPPYSTSKSVYNHINLNLADWVEEAIRIRNSA